MTDFSQHAGFAEQAAVSIAKKTGMSIHFLHGLWVGIDWLNLPKGKEAHYPEIQAQIDKAEAGLTERVAMAEANGIDAAKSMAFLQGYKSVLNATTEIPHDLIVMGSQGAGSYKNYSLGSNSSKVLRSAKAPVLVVQRPMPDVEMIKTIVFASGLEPDTHKSFDRLLHFTRSIGAENLHLIEVTTPNNFKPSAVVRKEMEDFISRHEDCKSIWLHNDNHYNIESGVLDLAHRVGADLLAIANHGRTDISSLFIESVPENLVKYTDMPVLSIRV